MSNTSIVAWFIVGAAVAFLLPWSSLEKQLFGVGK
jgi:hypothetical protein